MYLRMSYYYKYRHVIVSRNSETRYMQTFSCKVLNLNAWIKDGSNVSQGKEKEKREK